MRTIRLHSSPNICVCKTVTQLPSLYVLPCQTDFQFAQIMRSYHILKAPESLFSRMPVL